MDAVGESYEDCARLLVGRFASLVPVPGKRDFGIDFYVQPRITISPRTETVVELGALQVKGGNESLWYGGLDEKGEWREHEFAWLRSLVLPLYLARVDANFTAVELFSLWPLWLIFWRQSVAPFEVAFVTHPGSTDSLDWKEPQGAPAPNGQGHGDEKRWTVDLGRPILSLTSENLGDQGFRQNAGTILRTWIHSDRLTLMRFQQFTPVLAGITGWRTNQTTVLERRIWQFWDSRPGANIERLCETTAPMVINLGAHLQWQNDRAAYNLVPILEWLDSRGQLDPMGQGLLSGLRETQARGVGPNENPPNAATS